MQDFDKFVRSLADKDLEEIIKAIKREDAMAQNIAKLGHRAKRGSSERFRAEEAQDRSGRCGRILSFLEYNTRSTSATPADDNLCLMIKEKLLAKGQWPGGAA